MNVRILIFFAILLVSLYIALLVLLYVLQEKFIFHPTKLSPNYNFNQFKNFEEHLFKTPNDGIINVLHFKSQKPKGIVLYFHGNARSLDDWAWVNEDFKKLNYDLFIWDYRTYGKSQGSLSEKNINSDGKFLYDQIVKQFHSENIVLYGRSLGSGPAMELANHVKAKCLILETPYTSIGAMAGANFPFLPIKQLLKYKFNNIKKIKGLSMPVYIFSGTNDSITPHEHSIKLSKRIQKGKLITFQDGRHGNLSDFPLYHEELKAILK